MLCCQGKGKIKCTIFSVWNKKKGDVITMQKKRKYRYIIAFIFLGIGVVIFLALNICIGSVSITLSDILGTMTGQETNETISRILWDIRLPRTLAVIILGGALSLAGYLLQTFFHNPIADRKSVV